RPEVVIPNKVAISVEMQIRRVLEFPESVELLTLDPEELDEARFRASKEYAEAQMAKVFHNYRVLGRAELGNDEAGRAISAIYRGIDESDGVTAECFNPRHGLRAIRDGVTVELLICFECRYALVYVNNKQEDEPFYTSETPADDLNQIALELELPLPPAPMVEEDNDEMEEDE
ncbi:MAG: hypothetical protein KDB07_05895, partial [Planctomycetes bacterium]|nr:hypothetical protein [Planctomycetota bacterium]